MEQSEVIVIKVLSPCDIHKISMILLRNKFQMFDFLKIWHYLEYNSNMILLSFKLHFLSDIKISEDSVYILRTRDISR